MTPRVASSFLATLMSTSRGDTSATAASARSAVVTISHCAAFADAALSGLTAGGGEEWENGTPERCLDALAPMSHVRLVDPDEARQEEASLAAVR